MADLTFYVVAYDIPDDGRRTRVAKELLNFGDRVQGSVFEGRLTDARRDEMIRRLRRLVEPEEDRLRIYRFCHTCAARVVDLGLDEDFELPETVVI